MFLVLVKRERIVEKQIENYEPEVGRRKIIRARSFAWIFVSLYLRTALLHDRQLKAQVWSATEGTEEQV